MPDYPVRYPTSGKKSQIRPNPNRNYRNYKKKKSASYLFWGGWPVVFDKEVAVLEQAAAPDLLGLLGGDQLLVEVGQRLLKVAVHALPQHRGVKVFRDRHFGALVEQEQRVEDDVKRVDAELVLAFHEVDKLELDRLGPVVAERDQGPPVVVVDLDHFGDVGLLEGAGGHPFLGCALRQQVDQAVQHYLLHLK